MSSPREALQGRFRASLLKRVDNLAEMFELLELMPAEQDATRQVLGELHTLKGEARMLGLSALAELAHRLEEIVGSDAGVEFAFLTTTVESMRASLSSDDLSEGDEQLARVLARVDAAEQGPQPTPEASAPGTVSGPVGDNDSPERSREQERWVSVQATAVDDLCERVTSLAEGLGRLQRQVMSSAPGGGQMRQAALTDAFVEFRSLLEACVDVTWSLRLVTIEPMLQRLEQHARLLAQRASLVLNVQVEAGGVQLERDVVELVWDSLVHLVRNAVAHAFEEGSSRSHTLFLRAESVGPHVMISVRDDGQGIDPRRLRDAAVRQALMSANEAAALTDEECLQLVFRHGFSTHEEVDELSGRGVGLDVVKARIEGLGGSVRVHSRLGQGTEVLLLVPYAITKERIVVVDSGAGLYGIPVRVVRRVLGIEDLSTADSRSAIFEGERIPLRSLTRTARLPSAPSETSALVLELGGRLFALRVFSVIGERELIRRPAEVLLAQKTGIGASSVLNDGRLVLLLDLSRLERALVGQHVEQVPSSPRPVPARRGRVVVADDSPVVTEMVSELLTTAGLSVEVARDGAEALAAIERETPQLVITDLEMPNMNGLELLANIRSKSQSLPVVMLTTRGSVEDRRRASSAGANAYVLKSGFRSDVLLDVLRRFLSF